MACKRKGCVGSVIRVDRGLHYIKCPDCHPDWLAFREQPSRSAQ